MTRGHKLAVSVVIPTRGEEHQLFAAVMSAVEQTHTPHEVIIVSTGPMNQSLKYRVTALDPIVKTFALPATAGAAAARNEGVRRAAGAAVAFLDDDDVWHSGKLATQLASVGRHADAGDPWLASCRVQYGTRMAAPVELYRPVEPLLEYLLCRRHLRSGGSLMQSSTLMAPKAVCDAVPWPTIPRHQDWAWVAAVQDALPRIGVVQVPDVLVDMRVGHAHGLSAGGDWIASRTWWEQTEAAVSPRAAGDSLICVVSAIAATQGKPGVVLASLLRALRFHRPGWRAILLSIRYLGLSLARRLT